MLIEHVQCLSLDKEKDPPYNLCINPFVVLQTEHRYVASLWMDRVQRLLDIEDISSLFRANEVCCNFIDHRTHLRALGVS